MQTVVPRNHQVSSPSRGSPLEILLQQTRRQIATISWDTVLVLALLETSLNLLLAVALTPTFGPDLDQGSGFNPNLTPTPRCVLVSAATPVPVFMPMFASAQIIEARSMSEPMRTCQLEFGIRTGAIAEPTSS